MGPAGGRRPPARRHYQALRTAPRQRRDQLRSASRRGAGVAGRERRRQDDADEHPVRPLRGRRGRDQRRSARRLPPGSPKAALAAGIGMVHQHFTLADNLTVLDNVMLGTEPLWRGRTSAVARAASWPRLSRRLRPCGQPGRAHRRSLGRRAPAGRDPEGALSRCPHPHPRRTDRRADAAGDARRCSPRCRSWWRAAWPSSSFPTSCMR